VLVNTGAKRDSQIDGDSPPYSGMASALNSVKGLVSIVMGLALTHTIITLVVTDGGPDGAHAQGSAATASVLSLSEIPVQSALCAVALITAIVRFYHGNNRFLDLLYGEKAAAQDGDVASGGIGGNFIVIMVQSVFFALMSFYVDGSRQLMLLFGLLLLLDIFWFLANLTTTDTDPTALNTQKKWMINNLSFLVILVVLYNIKNEEVAVTAAATAILANTLVDFKISWKTYFPGFSAAKESLTKPGDAAEATAAIPG
jgi:hypothetical protein